MYERAKPQRGLFRWPLLYSTKKNKEKKKIVNNPGLRRKLRKCRNQWKTSAESGRWVDGESCAASVAGRRREDEEMARAVPSHTQFKRLCISVRSYLQYLLYSSYHITLFLGLLCNNLYSFACYRCNHFCFFSVYLDLLFFFCFFFWMVWAFYWG